MKFFTKHLDEVEESYFKHAIQAISVAIMCQTAVYTQLLHAVFPFIPPVLGTDVCSLINYLEKKLPENRRDDCR